MRGKIKEFMIDAWDEITYSLRCACGRPTRMKRFIIVSVIGGALSIAYIYMLVSSIYNIGKQDAEKEFMELQHIERLKLQSEKDSINSIKNYELKIKSKEYEYEQSDR